MNQNKFGKGKIVEKIEIDSLVVVKSINNLNVMFVEKYM